MKNKILSMLAAIAVAMTLSACQADDTGQTPPLIDSAATIVEETAEPIEMKTIEPPEDGWTVEQLNEVMYLNGKPFKLPCTVEDLGDKFSVQHIKLKSPQAIPFECSDSNNDFVTAELYYDNCMVGYIDMEKNTDDSYTVWGIAYLKSATTKDEKNTFNINSVSIFSNKIDVEENLGANFEESKINGMYTYVINDKSSVSIGYLVDPNSIGKVTDEIFSIAYYNYNIMEENV